MRTRNWQKVALGTIVAFMVLFGVTVARSQEDLTGMDGLNGGANGGLYRDMDGGYWCGGNCGDGQQCCRIVLIT